MRLLVVALVLAAATPVSAAVDVLDFANGDRVVGEIQSLSRGVLQIETAYSDSDFRIEWTEVARIVTATRFEIVLSDTDERFYGRLASSGRRVMILADDGRLRATDLDNIVFLGPLESRFWDRIFASIDVGFSLTKAQNLRQFTSRSAVGYRADTWQVDGSFNSLRSDQDDAEAIERSDGRLNYRYALGRGWYTQASVTASSNTEQKLDLRATGQGGMGKYFVRTNAARFGVSLGLDRNVERYSNDTPDRDSWEGYLGTELDIYDVGDLDLLLRVTVFPGLTKTERFRSSSTIDLKYELPYDFYVSLGFSLETDNLPAEGASRTDYVFHSGLGWEW